MLLTCITYLSNPYSFMVTLGFAVWRIYLQWGELVCFLFCVVFCPCRLPQFSAFTLPVVFKSQGVTLFWGCPHISLLIRMLVTWGFGELANKSIPKSITLAWQIKRCRSMGGIWFVWKRRIVNYVLSAMKLSAKELCSFPMLCLHCDLASYCNSQKSKLRLGVERMKGKWNSGLRLPHPSVLTVTGGQRQAF